MDRKILELIFLKNLESFNKLGIEGTLEEIERIPIPILKKLMLNVFWGAIRLRGKRGG